VLQLIEKAGTSKGLNLRGTNLEGCDLRGLSLRGADLRSAGLKEANLEGTDLAHARLDGLSWTTAYTFRSDAGEYADLTHTKKFESPKLEGVRGGPSHYHMSGAGLSSCDKIAFDGASLVAANLRGANLEGACLAGASLQEAKLQGASLIDIDLRLACLDKANLKGADLTKTKLSGASFYKANLESVNMAGVNLSLDRSGILYLGDGEVEAGPASLHCAYLKRANLKGASLLGVDLGQADLEGANLEDAEMGGAVMKSRSYSTNLFNAVVDGGLTWQQLKSANLKSSQIDIYWLPYSDPVKADKFIKDLFDALNGYIRCRDYERALLIIDMFYSSFYGHLLQDEKVINAIASIFDYKIDILNRLNRLADVAEVEKQKKGFPARLKDDKLEAYRRR